MSTTETKLPEFVIIGAGFSGLMMGLLLERMGASYVILERTEKLKPIGGTFAIQGNILAGFEQLGLLKEIREASLLVDTVYLNNKECKKLYSITWKERKEVTGYDQYVLSRFKLQDALVDRVPAHKILLNKKFERYEEINNRVVVHCADGSTFEGDILIGADGVHSKVRTQMYKQLSDINMLPASDTKPDTINYVMTVAIYDPKDPSKYPQLKESITDYSVTLCGNYAQFYVLTLANNQICWAISKQITDLKTAKKTDPFIDDRSQKGIEAMMNEFRDFLSPIGGTLGEMFDDTPLEKVSKVFVEENLRETWSHGRVVLTGDAVHKVNPVIAKGAMMAMQDAIILSNCIYDMDDTSIKSISNAFESYKSQRYGHAKEMDQLSRASGALLLGQTIQQRISRYLTFKLVPYSKHCESNEKLESYRPQVNWLPMIESKGTGLLQPQVISKRYKKE